MVRIVVRLLQIVLHCCGLVADLLCNKSTTIPNKSKQIICNKWKQMEPELCLICWERCVGYVSVFLRPSVTLRRNGEIYHHTFTPGTLQRTNWDQVMSSVLSPFPKNSGRDSVRYADSSRLSGSFLTVLGGLAVYDTISSELIHFIWSVCNNTLVRALTNTCWSRTVVAHVYGINSI